MATPQQQQQTGLPPIDLNDYSPMWGLPPIAPAQEQQVVPPVSAAIQAAQPKPQMFGKNAIQDTDPMRSPDFVPPVAPPTLTLPQQTLMDTLKQRMDAATSLANTPTGLTHAPLPSGTGWKGKGFWQHLGRIAEGIGNVAGDIFAPSTMALIPGTQLHRVMEANQGRAQQAGIQSAEDAALNDFSRQNLEAAQAAQISGGGTWKPLEGFSYTAADGKTVIPAEINERGEVRPALSAGSAGSATQLAAGQSTEQTPATTAPEGGLSGITLGRTPPAITPENQPLTQSDIDRLNALNAAQWATDHPKGEPMPPNTQLVPGDTGATANRIDAALKGVSTAAAGQAQRQSANAARDIAHQDARQQQLNNELDKLQTQYTKPIDTDKTNLISALDKVNAVRLEVNQKGAVGKALGLPALLVAVVGGKGTGVRITMPELNRLANARGITGSVDAFFNKISGQGDLSDQQVKEINTILDAIDEKVGQKVHLADMNITDISTASSRAEVTAANLLAQKRISQLALTGRYSGEQDVPPEAVSTFTNTAGEVIGYKMPDGKAYKLGE